MKAYLLCLVLAGACGKSSGSTKPAPAAGTTPAASTTPAANPGATGLAGAKRCHEAIAHMDSFTTAQPPTTGDDPPPPPGAAPPGQPPPSAADRAKEQHRIDQARAAGILADPTQDCIASWTNATVDCILAAKDSATADACVSQRR